MAMQPPDYRIFSRQLRSDMTLLVYGSMFASEAASLIRNSLLVSPSFPRGTVVLATGDGREYEDQHGFLSTLKTLHYYGYAIEVMSWQHSLNHELRAWASNIGRVIVLDDFYSELTFVEGGRKVITVNQLNRKLARRRLI
jgi:hypothetical protein